MKKNLAFLAILLCEAQSVKAFAVFVRNSTGKSISVAVEGSWKHYNSLNAITIKPGHESGIVGAPKKISGPLRFAFTDEMKKKRYAFYETYLKATSTTGLIGLHVHMPQFFDISRVQIAMKSGQPAIRPSYPKNIRLIRGRPEQHWTWRPFKKIEITRETQIGKTAEW